ncbi:MAG TPA: 3-dehydroquinate synthase [Bacteroidales bacterium]|nr:3-dehydroquinate synthase [Bacteroidales bacterium]
MSSASSNSFAAVKYLSDEPISNLRQHLPAQSVIITQQVIQQHYGQHWQGLPVILIGDGEQHKTLLTMHDIYQQLIDLDIDRSGMLVGVGGGIVCDIAGFAAATYLRGVACAFVPTTLLAQADASIGGKNGINFQGFKNMVGTFYQPRFILSDPATLQTLPPYELANGLAEVVKHALIADAAYFDFIEDNFREILNLDKDAIRHITLRSYQIKSDVVLRDEKEQNLRRILNFGHTYGHAIEKVAGISHGHAVSIGMAAALRLSLKHTSLSQNQYERIIRLLQNLNLPISTSADARQIVDALTADKKREGGEVHFVLLENIGQAVIKKIAVTELQNFMLSP